MPTLFTELLTRNANFFKLSTLPFSYAMRIFFFIKADIYSTEKMTKEKKLSSRQRTKTKEQKILFNYVAASALTEHKFMVELRSFRRGDVTFFPDEFSVSRNDVRQEILSVDLRDEKDPSL